ncbi:MAG TPA: DNA polymerase III subunit delta' [bacterium]|nr:DNA polymerase III subunit delta' [bacterium]HPR89045.1 DNA polymerase III subunit delta' [bacterium]
MSFAQIIGQNRPKEILARALQTGQIPHAYLFTGPAGVGKEALAIEMAKAILCSSGGERPCDDCSACRRVGRFGHPDFLYLFPMPKTASVEEERGVLDSLIRDPYLRELPWAAPTIGIERIRELRRVSGLKPLEGRRVVVIAEADKMTPEASNALLKILEEPPAEMQMILTTSRDAGLLPTIISRCQRVDFSLLTNAEIAAALVARRGVAADQAQLVARIAQGNFRHALELLEENLQERRNLVIEALRICLKDDGTRIEWAEQALDELDKREQREFYSLMLVWFRDVLVLSAHPEAAAQDQLVNVDQLEVLHNFVKAFSEIRFEAIFAELERSIEMLDRNVHPTLIMVVLLARLNQNLIRKGSKI